MEDREIAFLNMRSRFSILNMMHPKYLLVRGENQEQHIRTCSEIARLQQMSGLLVSVPVSEIYYSFTDELSLESTDTLKVS